MNIRCKCAVPINVVLIFTALLAGFSGASPVAAQQFDRPYPIDTLQYELSEMEIQASRDSETEATAPFSVTLVNRSLSEQNIRPGYSLDQIAASVPGLWINDRQNYALGERVSIRGMGWRTAFGVRGIYVMLDDIPLTVPDGQTVMDILDPTMVQQLEVIRGPSSSFWGNASGGTLLLSTRPHSFEPSLTARVYGGAFGTYSSRVSGTFQEGPRGYHLNASYMKRDGYRDHSRHQVFRVTGHMNWQLAPDRSLRINGAFVDAPDTRHPGTLSASDIEENRRAAAALFENASAGKTWRQGQLGATYTSENDMGRWQGTLYGISRTLHNPLPFADIEVDRLSGGSRISLMNDDHFIHWGVGADAAIQSDDRRNYEYVDMQEFERGEIEIDQQETVLNGAVFARIRTSWDRVNFSGGIRVDAIRFESDDRLDRLQSGEVDQSGSRMFTAWSPAVGASWQTRPGLFYVNFGTSFETPTTTELVNRPDMTGGFNPEIDPERARGYEAGFRGGWPVWQLRYDVAVFRMNVRDQLVSFRTEDGGDRDFYRNAGTTRHDGIELSLRWRTYRWMEFAVNYNWSHFTFRESVETDQVTFTSGNRLPGIPEHRMMAQWSLMPQDFRISVTMEMVDSYFADNANTARNSGYEVFHLHLGHDGIALADGWTLAPFVTINNITDTRYNSSVSINANGGRYFEPAPGRAVYAGFRISI